jgi:hypothetical protein
VPASISMFSMKLQKHANLPTNAEFAMVKQP